MNNINLEDLTLTETKVVSFNSSSDAFYSDRVIFTFTINSEHGKSIEIIRLQATLIKGVRCHEDGVEIHEYFEYVSDDLADIVAQFYTYDGLVKGEFCDDHKDSYSDLLVFEEMILAPKIEMKLYHDIMNTIKARYDAVIVAVGKDTAFPIDNTFNV